MPKLDTTLFEKSRFKGCPPICLHSNLPAFDDDASTKKFLDQTAGEHPNPILAKWICDVCGKIHFWTTSPTDSNGQFKGGAETLPKRIKKLVDRSKQILVLHKPKW